MDGAQRGGRLSAADRLRRSCFGSLVAAAIAGERPFLDPRQMVVFGEPARVFREGPRDEARLSGRVAGDHALKAAAMLFDDVVHRSFFVTSGLERTGVERRSPAGGVHVE